MVRAVSEDDTGIEVLYEPGDPNIDIIAIHGLGAHPDETWCKNIGTPENSQWINWLEAPDMLPSIASNARIMRYGYESAWFGPEAIKQSTTDAAEEFLDDLRVLRERSSYRPLIIIAHCYGGLVALKAMNHARLHSKRWPDLLSYTAGLVFFGTPFRGAEGISQSELLQAAIEINQVVQPQTLRIFDPGNDPLEDLVTDFCRIHSVPHKAQIACFYEQKPSNIMAIVGKDAQKTFVVSRSSGCLDESETTQKYRLARTHFDMNKFGKPSERGFIKVAQVIKDMVEKAPELLLSRFDVQVDAIAVVAAVKHLTPVSNGSQMRMKNERAETIKYHLKQLVTETFKKADINAKSGSSCYQRRETRHCSSAITKIIGMIQVHSFVDTNHKTHHQVCGSLTGKLISQTYQDEAQLANGTISIRTLQCKDVADNQVSLMSLVQFRTDVSQYQQFMFSVHLFQSFGEDGLKILPPCIIAHAVVPDDSPVIEAVRTGNFGKLTRLLENGQARVWDCDSEGRSLLHVAIFSDKPRMVEYLIAQGLDVNTEEASFQIDSYRRHLLPITFTSSVESRLAIETMLLKAGSDPAMDYLTSVINIGTVEELRAIFEASHYFIPVDLALLEACVDTSRLDTWAKIQLLVKHGTLNDWKQTSFIHMKRAWSSLDYFRTLCGFLHSGVDIDTKNSEGLTLHDLLQKFESDIFGSRPIDILRFAAEQESPCNPGFQDWIFKHPRKPSVYTSRYTPFDHLSIYTKLNHDESIQPDGDTEGLDLAWKQLWETGVWPETSPEQEHIVAHGSYVIRLSIQGEHMWNKCTSWTPNSEKTIGGQLECNIWPDEVLKRESKPFPCADCIARWLHDTGSPYPSVANDGLYPRGGVRFVATSTGGIWDLENNVEGYSTYAWVPAPSSEWMRSSYDGVEKVFKTVHVPRLSEVLDSDIDMQQEDEAISADPPRRRARAMSPSDDEDRTIKRPKFDDFEHDPTSPGSNSDFSDS